MKTQINCRTIENPRNATNLQHASVGERSSGVVASTFTRYRAEQSKENSGGSAGKVAVSLLAGAGVGVLAGMLLAPEKGKVLRKQMSNSATTLGNTVKEKVQQGYSAGREKATSWMSKGKNDNSSNSSNMQKSPYTDPGKWDDQENRNMTNTARNTPGV